MTSNPILGVGLGNWKIKSIDYDSKDIKGYVVPYHAHSDFIQLGAELGVLGFLLYSGLFLIAIIYSLKLLIKKDFENEIFVKVRSTGKLLNAKVSFSDQNGATVNLKVSEDGISPGQACVFYNRDKLGYKVLGGGWIKE